MPCVSVEVNRDDGQNSRCEQLLALCELRRGVERLAALRGAHGRTSVALTTEELLRELHELIAALDRRVPHIERAGEAAIARDAARLREQAMKRLSELDEQYRRDQGRT
jgi:hypothetical protein